MYKLNIKKAFLKKVNWALAGFLSILGFVGCEKKTLMMQEYASPLANYTVKGAVVNKTTEKPIAGIRVGYSPDNKATKPLVSFVLTNAKGEFSLTGDERSVEHSEPFEYKKISVYVEDVDGEENGLFESEKIQVDFSKVTQNKGEYTVNINIELTQIENP